MAPDRLEKTDCRGKGLPYPFAYRLSKGRARFLLDLVRHASAPVLWLL